MKVKSEKFEDPTGFWSLTLYNENGKFVGYNDSDGYSIVKKYLPNGLVQSISMIESILYFDYDEQNRCSKITKNFIAEPNEELITEFLYEENVIYAKENGALVSETTTDSYENGYVIHTKESNGFWETNYYIGDLRVRYENEKGENVFWNYDDNGLLLSIVLNDSKTEFQYKHGFLVSEKTDETITEYEYDDIGNLVSVSENGKLKCSHNIRWNDRNCYISIL
jgi:YD repeat-containing protein